MGVNLRRLSNLFILFCIIYMAMAQPGAPFCWLHPHACELHPHFSPAHAAEPHHHDDLFNASHFSQALPILLAPLGALLVLLSIVAIYRSLPAARVHSYAWITLLEPPPPRPVSS